MGVPEEPYDALVSDAARERWSRWRSDLKAAERKARKAGQHVSRWQVGEVNSPAEETEQARIRREHTTNMIRGSRFNNQLVSPIYSVPYNTTTLDASPPHSDDSIRTIGGSEDLMMTPDSLTSDIFSESAVVRPDTVQESSRSAFINSTQKVPTISQLRDTRITRNSGINRIAEDSTMQDAGRVAAVTRNSWDGSADDTVRNPHILTAGSECCSCVPLLKDSPRKFKYGGLSVFLGYFANSSPFFRFQFPVLGQRNHRMPQLKLL
jgi:taspase (threonine aspartase 1)